LAVQRQEVEAGRDSGRYHGRCVLPTTSATVRQGVLAAGLEPCHGPIRFSSTQPEANDRSWDLLSPPAADPGSCGQDALRNLRNGELEFNPSSKLAVILIGTNNTDDRKFPHL
jgi:hypothetical protein